MKCIFEKLVRSLCYNVSIVGAANSGKSSLYNYILDELNVNNKRSSVVSNIANYSIEYNENVVKIEKKKCVFIDTIGLNEMMITKLEQWKLKEYNITYEKNNIVKNYYNTIINSDLLLFCLNPFDVRIIDIISYNIIHDIYKEHANILTVVYNAHWKEGTCRTNGIAHNDYTHNDILRNLCDIFESFKNIVFYPSTFITHDEQQQQQGRQLQQQQQQQLQLQRQEDLLFMLRHRIKEISGAIKRSGNYIRRTAEQDEATSTRATESNPQRNADQDDEEMLDLIDESLRIFQPSLTKETKNYFYKFVNLKKKEKLNDALFNSYFSEHILKKSLRRITQSSQREANEWTTENKEEENVHKNNIENGEHRMNKSGKMWQADDSIAFNNLKKEDGNRTAYDEEPNDYFYFLKKMQSNKFEERKKMIGKLKNKRIQILKNIINRDENANPYDLINLSERYIFDSENGAGVEQNEDEASRGNGNHRNETPRANEGYMNHSHVDNTDRMRQDHADNADNADNADRTKNDHTDNRNGIIPPIVELNNEMNSDKGRKRLSSRSSTPNNEINICVLGEQNCGKTTLVESILKENIINEKDVYALFGRRKYINNDMCINYKDKQIQILDSCSLKKQHKFINEDMYHNENNRVYNNIRKSSICIYIKEAKNNSIQLHKEDKKMIFYLLKEKKNILFLISKADLIITDFEKKKCEFLKIFQAAFNDIPVMFINTNNTYHIQSLLHKVVHIHNRNNSTISTSTLNLFLTQFLKLFPIPWKNKKKCHFKFIKQIRTNPVTFLIFTNLYKQIPNNYLSFFKKKLKHEFDLKYVNIQFVFKTTCENRHVRKNQRV
ncbi:Ras-like G protein, putative [Plasmodium malariae]|uniref:Ras-like G protein, putative n=1 Tax=Plasmodium malariae TaxID=5858 RepID=A0A1D3PAT0_PLAMA|nr:Ras-like G protein, putative [Plasmodium malariae]SCN12302.1 Ras-like G protein, putative [Plasmodium malariae]